MLTCCPATTPGPPRVAYAIGRSAGGAVDRNRIRRRLRHVVAAHEAELRPGYQYLIGATPGALRTPAAELDAGWRALLTRAHEDTP